MRARTKVFLACRGRAVERLTDVSGRARRWGGNGAGPGTPREPLPLDRKVEPMGGWLHLEDVAPTRVLVLYILHFYL
jgi:hypothetical protein